MKLKQLSFILLFALLFSKCSKDQNAQKYCWQIVDFNGNNLQQICNKTEDEIVHCTDCGFAFGSTNWNLTPCQYYKVIPNEPTYCWLINGNQLKKNLTKTYVDYMRNCTTMYKITTATMINCDSCQYWQTRLKYIIKTQNNRVDYSSSKKDLFCGDTLATLYNGRDVKIRETIDSIIYFEFIYKQ